MTGFDYMRCGFWDNHADRKLSLRHRPHLASAGWRLSRMMVPVESACPLATGPRWPSAIE